MEENKPPIWKIVVSGVPAGGLALTPQNAKVGLIPGAAVQVHFEDGLVQGSRIAAVVLDHPAGTAPERPVMGPFTCLTRIGTNDVYFTGFTHNTDSVEYRAVLIDSTNGEIVEQSLVGKLSFEALGERLPDPQHVSVAVELSESPSGAFEPALRVEPESLVIVPGESAVWRFDIPGLLLKSGSGWFPMIYFKNNDPANPAPMGPFTAITTVLDPATGSVFVIASGDNGKRGRFGYDAQLRSPTGPSILRSVDPGIDNDGSPMTPPGG